MKLRNGFIFVAGFLATILLVALLGRFTLTQPQFPEIKRFWTMQSPATNFFPTIRQQYEWTKDQTTRSKITIIFGGSSFLLGNGQPVNQSTAVVLQEKLGSKYSVVNLAVRGGGAFGQGLYIASKLKKDGYKVIYVSDINPAYAPPFENDGPYAYSYWQALYANYLSAVPARDIEKPVEGFNYKSVVNFLNNYLYFQELANFISYNYFKFNNSPVTGGVNFDPLRKSPDDEMVIPYVDRHLNVEIESAYTEQALAYADRYYITQKNIDEVSKLYRKGINRGGNPRTILVACESNPRYLKPLNEELLRNYYSIIDKQVQSMNALGLEAHAACRDFVDQDYGDIIHLVPSGADKLATKLEGWIINE